MKNITKIFFTYYFLFYGSLPMYSIFIPIILKEKGFSQTKIGMLLSLAPIIAIVSMPIWGAITDRMKSKNRVLKYILIFSGLSMLIFSKVNIHSYIFIAYGIFSFFNSSTISLGDTIALESLEKINGNYGSVRLGGTVGYAVMAILAGKIASYNQSYVFVAYFILMIATLITLGKVPTIKGHMSSDNKGSIKDILRNKEILMMLVFNLLIFITICFYNSFFSLYYNTLTKDRTLLGIAYSIAALSEVPFLLNANKIIRKIGIYKLMISAFFITGIRWILMGMNYNPYVALGLQVLHGWGFMVFMYVIVIYIHNNVDEKLKTTGQSLVGVFGSLGIASIIGNQVGGYLCDKMDINTVFIYCGIFMIMIMFLFIVIFPKMKMKNDFK